MRNNLLLLATFFLVASIFFISSVSGLSTSSSSSSLSVSIPKAVAITNYSKVNVNNSLCWQGLCNSPFTYFLTSFTESDPIHVAWLATNPLSPYFLISNFQASFDSNFSSKTTDNLAQGTTNLYANLTLTNSLYCYSNGTNSSGVNCQASSGAYNSTYDATTNQWNGNTSLLLRNNTNILVQNITAHDGNFSGGVNVAENFIVNTSKFFVNASSGKIGIGKIPTANTLEILGNVNASSSGRFEGGLAVGMAPVSTTGLGVTLSTSAMATVTGYSFTSVVSGAMFSFAKGMTNTITASGTGADGTAISNTVTCSGPQSTGKGFGNTITATGSSSIVYGFYNVLTSSGENTGQRLYGMYQSINPHATDEIAYGAQIVSALTTINNPTQDQMGIKLEWQLQGADNNMKKWALYNSGAIINGSKIFLGKDNIKTYWGKGYNASIYYDGTNLNINPKEVGIGNLNVLSGINFTGDLFSNDNAFNFNGTSHNLIISGNVTAVVYHGMIDWINVPISVTLTGTTACTNLNNLVAGYAYTCQTCVDSLAGTQIACGTIASVMENCACKIS